MRKKLKPRPLYYRIGVSFHVEFIFYGYITNSQCDQLPDGVIVQLLEQCTDISEVIDSNPVQA